MGSSLFLKALYGVGYYLTLVKDTKKKQSEDNFEGVVDVSAARKSSAAPTCSLNSVEDTDDEGISDLSTHETIINPSEGNTKFPIYPLTKFIQKHIPNARLVEEIGSDIVFSLPVEDSKETQFENLFNELDRNMKKLRITTYGLSDTTLEEVEQIYLYCMEGETSFSILDFPQSCQ